MELRHGDAVHACREVRNGLRLVTVAGVCFFVSEEGGGARPVREWLARGGVSAFR